MKLSIYYLVGGAILSVVVGLVFYGVFLKHSGVNEALSVAQAGPKYGQEEFTCAVFTEKPTSMSISASSVFKLVEITITFNGPVPLTLITKDKQMAVWNKGRQDNEPFWEKTKGYELISSKKFPYYGFMPDKTLVIGEAYDIRCAEEELGPDPHPSGVVTN